MDLAQLHALRAELRDLIEHTREVTAVSRAQNAGVRARRLSRTLSSYTALRPGAARSAAENEVLARQLRRTTRFLMQDTQATIARARQTVADARRLRRKD